MVPLVGEGEPPGLEEHAFGLDERTQNAGVRPFGQPEPDDGAAILRLHGSPREVKLERIVHHVASLLVDARELCNEAIEVSPLEKQRDASLVVDRWVAEDVVAKRPRLPDELAIGNQVSDAQSRQERLREAAGIVTVVGN